MFKFCIIVFLFCIRNLFADVCPPGMYKVRSHPRSSYYRTDGVFVSNTVVEDYCKNYRNEGPHQLKFLEKMPKNYPLKKEHFKKCNSENAKIIGHELSHFLWENLSSQEKASYYEIAQWREIKDLKLFVTNRDKFTATDGKTSP